MRLTDTAVAANAPRYPIRRLLVLLAALAAPLIGYGQMALDIGLSPGEFAAQGDSTLRVAGYAFSIWGVIYVWLIAYGVYQALPATAESDVLLRLGWPSALALSGVGLWVLASAADWEWATVGIILAAKLCLLVPLIRHAGLIRQEPTRRRALTAWPLALLAGWLTVASVVNILTAATSQGLISPDTANGWALAGVGWVTAFTLWATARMRIWTYPVPVTWGLAGAAYAEWTDGDALLAGSALAAAALIGLGAALILSRRA